MPKSDLPPTSDTAGVAAMSSPMLKVEPMLALLEGKSIGVTSVHLTSTGFVGLMTCNRALFGKTTKRNSLLRIAGDTPVQ